MLLKWFSGFFGKKNQEGGRMIKLKEYKLYKTSGEMCTLEYVAKGKDAYAVGKTHDERDDLDGKMLCTARIVDIYNRVIVTNSGKVYALETMHPDYEDFLITKAAEILRER